MILPTAYWGPCSYIDQLLKHADAIEVCESFEKQTFRNRCWIEDMQGRRMLLTVPVQKVEHKQLTRDIEISYQSRWQHQHWVAIKSAYEHSPFYLYFADLIQPLYQRQTRFLVDLNEQIMSLTIGIIQRTLSADGRNDKPFCLPRTQDWSGEVWTDQHPWQNELSILDRLMREGA